MGNQLAYEFQEDDRLVMNCTLCFDVAVVIVISKWFRTNFCKFFVQLITVPFSGRLICPGCKFAIRKKKTNKNG